MTRLSLLVLALVSTSTVEAQFSYRPSGELERPGGGTYRAGAGRVDSRVYAPGMLFPIAGDAAYANSQIYGHGGYMGPGGGQCSAGNYAYPWHDNYCEERSWDMPLCPGGTGHQGQDIRPGTCVDNTHAGVAAVDGTITNVGSYSVYLTGADGTRYDYLHMRSVAVSVGDRVTRGQRLGRVSDNFGGTSTTIHLHFNLRQNVSGVGTVYVPPYMSLVRAFEATVGPPPFRATFVRQSFPFARDPFELAPGEVVSGSIELRNEGEETWRPGEVFLGTTEPRDGDSAFAAPSWPSPHRAATVDAETATGEVGVFHFDVRAPDAPGDYPQFFNLVREGVAWFSDSGQGGPADDQLQVRVTTVAGRCAAGADAWRCEGTARVRCVDGTTEREACVGGCADGACTDVVDDDGDGHALPDDCDDGDPTIHPGAREICDDGIDQDCSGADAMCVPEIDRDGGVAGDAGSASDGGMATLEGGCGCSMGASNPSGAWLSLLAFALVLRRRRSARG